MTDRVLKLLFTALHAEAAPLILHYDLKRDDSVSIPVFSGDHMHLFVTGMGKVRAALSVGYAAASALRENAIALNIGIAGAHPGAGLNIGELLLVHKITDHGSGREFFPDMMARTDLKESTLTTWDVAVTGEDVGESSQLVDMEASGFYEGASSFLGPHAIACLKIVSDFCTPEGLTKESITGLVESNIEGIAAFIDVFESVGRGAEPPIGQIERKWMGEVTNALRLTKTQQNILTQWVTAFKAGGGQRLPRVRFDLKKPVATKQEGKRLFLSLRKEMGVE